MRNQRPLAVTILAWVYIVVGITGFIDHLTEFRASGGFRQDDAWVELVRLLAIISGAFMLRGQNWARWLAVAWIGAHVVLSAFHTAREFAMHCLFCAAIAWFLFRPEATKYFRHERLSSEGI